jgi:predicted flap endonuclease-1-like 5' DNA nuclease
MTFLLLQTFALLLASYFLGAFLACTVKRMVVGSRESEPLYVPAHVHGEVPVRSPIGVSPQPAARRRFAPAIAPRPIDPIQPRIDVLRRPEPRSVPQLIDPARFERALMGPDPNEGIPRIAISEIRPAVLKRVTGAYVPGTYRPPPEPVVELPPEPEPPPEPKPKPVRVKATREPVPSLEVAEKSAEHGPVPAKKTSKPFFKFKLRNEPAEPAAEPLPVETPAKASGPSDATTSAAAAAVAVAKAAAAALTVPVIRAEERPEPVKIARAAEPAAASPHAEPSADRKPKPQPVANTPPAEKVAAAPIEGGDDFQRIRAIDTDLEKRLKGQGINYFEDVAAWTAADVKKFSQTLGIPGRIDREQWIEQAQILARGGETYYSRSRAAQKTPDSSSSPTIATVVPEAAKPAVIAKAREEAQTKSPPADKERGDTAAPVQPVAAAAVKEAPPAAAQKPVQLSGVAAASQGRSVAEMAAAAAAAIAAASASVTRGLKPIEPISPLSKVDPKISIPAKLSDAIKEKEAATASSVPDDDRETVVKRGPTAEGPAEDLKRIRGIGVLIDKRLNGMGVTRYEQIANWTSGDIDRVSRVLEFKGRIEREGWVEQARILSSGGQTEFSRRVDRGEVDTSRET